MLKEVVTPGIYKLKFPKLTAVRNRLAIPMGEDVVVLRELVIQAQSMLRVDSPAVNADASGTNNAEAET
jgi:hypothetical protein